MEKNHYSRTSVAIIGGGLSGSLLAIKLLRQTKIPLQIFLIESAKKRYGRGVAYSPNSIYQKLNVTAKNMSLFEDNPMHFYDWWKSRNRDYFYLQEKFDENSFFPRFIYGDYLEANLNFYANNKPEFIDFLPINDEAVDATLDSSRWSITLASGTILHVQLLVLATGNIPPANPSYLSKEVLENKRYLDNPWNDSLFETINAKDNIGILGSGLSMVDVLMTLKRKDFDGKIVSFSRSGKFPLVHEAPTVQIPSQLPEFAGALRSDLKMFREWINQNSEVSSANLISAIRPHISKIWKSWETKDQLYWT